MLVLTMSSRYSMYTDTQNQTRLRSNENRIDECYRLLLDAGADPVVEGHSEKTVLLYLLRYKTVVRSPLYCSLDYFTDILDRLLVRL